MCKNCAKSSKMCFSPWESEAASSECGSHLGMEKFFFCSRLHSSGSGRSPAMRADIRHVLHILHICIFSMFCMFCMASLNITELFSEEPTYVTYKLSKKLSVFMVSVIWWITYTICITYITTYSKPYQAYTNVLVNDSNIPKTLPSLHQCFGEL